MRIRRPPKAIDPGGSMNMLHAAGSQGSLPQRRPAHRPAGIPPAHPSVSPPNLALIRCELRVEV
jgi:hypothetical protein